MVECSYHLRLDRPLGDRTVIDGFNGEPVPLNTACEELERRSAQHTRGAWED